MCCLTIGRARVCGTPPQPTWHNLNDSDSDQWLRQPERSDLLPAGYEIERVGVGGYSVVFAP
jgi:hypothetical protein